MNPFHWIYRNLRRVLGNIFGKIIFLIIIFVLIGTFGFYILEISEQSALGSFTLLDSFYWTMITITTIGFGDIAPLTPGGQALAIVLAIFGVALISTTFALVSINLIESEFFKKHHMERIVKKMSKIMLICGFNDRIRILIEELGHENIKVVVVNNEPVPEDWQDEWGAYIQGDPTEDQTLLRAGVERAKKALVSLNDDGDTLLAILSIQSTNKECYLIAEVCNKTNLKHFQRIKCNQTICQEEILGKFLNIALLLPELVPAYNELISMEGCEIYKIDEIKEFIDKSFEETMNLVKQKYDALLIGILRKNRSVLNPKFSEKIQEKDVLLVISETFVEDH